MSAFHLVQLSDTHVLGDEGRTHGVAPNDGLRRAVAAVNRLVPPADLVMVTGDLTDHGGPAEYERLGEILRGLDAPWRLVIGNHDEREPLLDHFGGTPELPVSQGWVQYSLDDVAPFRIVVTDTHLVGRHDGGICDERLAWLDDTLSAEPDRPTLLALHHPPFDTGIFWMDGGGFNQGRADLLDVLSRHPQVALVICGHIHRSITTVVSGIPMVCAPGTAHQVALDLGDGAAPAFSHEPAGFAVHRWADGRFTSHLAPVAAPVLDIPEIDATLWAKAKDRLGRRRPLYKRPPTPPGSV